MIQERRNKEPTRREKRRLAILDAAREVFLQQGYGATSLNDIVRVSGGSLATLYDLFDGKAGLFRETIELECRNFFSGLDSENIDALPLREALLLIARQFFDGVTQQPKMSLLRIVVAEAPHFPEVGTTFYSAGPQRGRQIVSTYLEKLSRRGLLKVGDAVRAADVFIALVLGEYQMKMLCGEEFKLTPEEVDRYLNGALDDFLRIYDASAAGVDNTK